jgi:hypothetical protein
MSPEELARSLAATAAKQRELTLARMRPKVVELSLGSALNKETGQPERHTRRVPGRQYLSAEARRQVEQMTSGTIFQGGPTRRPG